MTARWSFVISIAANITRGRTADAGSVALWAPCGCGFIGKAGAPQYKRRRRGAAGHRWIRRRPGAGGSISAREHFDMVEALEARDVKQLQKIIAQHVGQDIS